MTEKGREKEKKSFRDGERSVKPRKILSLKKKMMGEFEIQIKKAKRDTLQEVEKMTCDRRLKR